MRNVFQEAVWNQQFWWEIYLLSRKEIEAKVFIKEIMECTYLHFGGKMHCANVINYRTE